MHHLYPSVKGDPLCPLGFHPQVRWPTRCKRCFRDYKEHGSRKKEEENTPLRRDDVTASSPSLTTWGSSSSRNRDDARSNSVDTTVTLPRSWASSTNLFSTQDESTDSGLSSNSSGSSSGRDSSKSSSGSSVSEPPIRFNERPASWTSTPDLGNLADGTHANVTTVHFTLPRRRPQSSDTGQETVTLRKPSELTINASDNLATRVKKLQASKDANKSADKLKNDADTNRRIKVKEVKASIDEPTKHDVQFLIQIKSKSPQLEKSKTNVLTNRLSNISESSSGGASSNSDEDISDDASTAGTETTDTTLVSPDNELQEQIDSLKDELDTMRSRCERLEREKSDILLRRLASYETTTSKTTASEVLKLQQKVNELQSHSEDLLDEKKSLSLKVRELEEELDSRPTSSEAKRTTDELRAKLAAAETLCEELMDENEDMKKELRDLEEEIEEMQDNFREDQADEYTSLKKELEQTAKNCRILSFKLRKSERKIEQLESEKQESEKKLQDISGSQNAISNVEKIKHLEQELKVSNEVSVRLQKELEETNKKLAKAEKSEPTIKKKPPMLGKLSTAEGKVSRESLTRGGSQDDPVQLLRDLQDSLEREADLREQLKFAEEEAQNLRKKISRVEDDNESLVLQLKKMATKARSRKLSPTAPRLIPENSIDKDEGISDEEDPAELRILLELNEQEAAVLRRKVEDMERENDTVKRKVKDLQDKLAKRAERPTLSSLQSGSGGLINDQKMKVLENEMSDLRKKLIEKERDCERLHAELSLSQKPKTKGMLVKSKSLDGDQQTVDLKRQLQVIEQEATVLRGKTQTLEADNEKLLADNKRLQLLQGTKKLQSEKSIDIYVDKIAALEIELSEVKNKAKEPNKLGLISKTTTDKDQSQELTKLKEKLTKIETERDKLTETIKRLKGEAAKVKARTPKKPTDLTTKLQLRKMVDELESEIGEFMVLLKNSETNRSQLETELKTAKESTKVTSELEKITKELSEIKIKCAAAEKELADEKKKSAKEQKELKSTINKTDDSLKTLKDDLLKTQTEKGKLDNETKTLREEKVKLTNELKEQKGITDQKTKEIEQLNTKIKTFKDDVDEKTKNIEKLKKELELAEKAEQEKNKLIKDVGDKTKKMTEMEKKLKEADEKLKRNEKLLAAKKDEITKLEKDEALLKTEGINNSSIKITELQGELSTTQTKLKSLETQLENTEKEKQSFEEKLNKLEVKMKTEKTALETKTKELEVDLNAERKKCERMKINQEKEQKNREMELGTLRSKIRTLEDNSGMKKLAEAKKENQLKIDKLQKDLSKSTQDYEDLTTKYEMLEEEHVVMKAQLVTEKELITSQLQSTQHEFESIDSELQTLRETYNKKQDAWIKEKLDMQEKLSELEEKISHSVNESVVIERNRFKAAVEEKTNEAEQLRKESEVLKDQLDTIRRENDELKKKLDDFDKVSKIQRNITADSNALEKEVRQLKNKITNSEKVHKTDLTQCKMRYDNQITVLSEELQSLQMQVTRFKRERDNFKHMLESAQKTIGDLKSNSLKRSGNDNRNSIVNYDEKEETKNKIQTLEQQVSCMEDELSEARLECSKVKTEFVSERSSWEVKLSEMQSRVNELEEERILSSGRTKIPGLRTRMELAWHKEREEQQRLLQETSTLARDLRQTLFEVERERDKERLEAKRKQDQLKKTVEEEQEENRKKLTEIQCDLLELRDAHAKLRTTNEKLRREKERYEREREDMKSMMSTKRRTDQEEEKRLSTLLSQVDQLIGLVPELVPIEKDGDTSNLLAMTPTPPRRSKSSKSRESSPLLERRSMSKEPSPRRDDKQIQLQSTLQRLTNATEELRRYQRLGDAEREKERAKRFGMRRAASTENENTTVELRLMNRNTKRNGINEKGNLHRRSLSLEQTSAQQDQNIWKMENDSLSSLQSLESDSRFYHMKRDSSLDSRLSGGSTQSEIITVGDDRKKKKSFIGKLKKLTKSHSTDDSSNIMGSNSSQIHQGSDSDISVSEDIKSSKQNLKGRLTGMFKRSGSSSRSNSVERKPKSETADSSSSQRPLTRTISSNDSTASLPNKKIITKKK